MDFHPRHGTVLPITNEEANRLKSNFTTFAYVLNSAKCEGLRPINIVVDEVAKKVTFPLESTTDLSIFKPQFSTDKIIVVKQIGNTDFSKGDVTYKLKIGNKKENYIATTVKNQNPVLNGLYADPEILYSEKTGKFYMYPTSDGFTGWSGTYFKCFSSDNLVNWKDEGIILQLGKDVSWANRNAWAPCIEEKKIYDQYKYFYYFSAGQKIGVADSDNPTGPFIDLGKPLINNRPEGTKGGQVIDQDVFTDPKTGKSYLYWGNGFMAGAELNDDMTSIKKKR